MRPNDVIIGSVGLMALAWMFWPQDRPAAPVAQQVVAATTAPAPTPAATGAPTPAPDFPGVRYLPGGDPAIRAVETDPDNPVLVYARDMRPDVTSWVICPQPDPLIRARGAIAAGDPQALDAAVSGQGCFLATDGHGAVTAVHVQSLARVRWDWLVGTDLDTMTPQRLENSGREDWALSTQLGTMPGNRRVEPLIEAAFR